ncbi:GYDIA family GHMP kinase [Lentiprolixibacter aurantiacus]|uniref:GYDIA family GHMP kinase n=1 Tax=Lentiprolixibacter aurantiacus TaxID=2993939 RepID=A0AAE3SN58_9FLAO|nr:GYDIA family GHMP kinase [Lentiprolixibacter aurantiacus]MCX2718082.1 GYDIA family GHMP kinase [Lentiprolixibacter aurantiacus]
MKTYYSSGKLLLSGEYAVLDGALCLALPTKYGQHLQVTAIEDPLIEWTSKDHDNTVWLKEKIPLNHLADVTKKTVSGMAAKEILIQVLGIARKLNPDFLSDPNGHRVETRLEFPREWGLGTSSTLINNIAQWAGVDPYVLSDKTFGGSGYDIACAQSNSPLLYQRHNQTPRVERVNFRPPFFSSLFFVYLNRKQDSREAIKNYRNQSRGYGQLVEQISSLSRAIVECSRLEEFESLLTQHESLISEALKTPTIKGRLFADYPRSIKSLGAWGGDFVLAVGKESDQDYFIKKGYRTIISYTDMIA